MQKTILLIDDDEEEFYIFKLALEMAEINYNCVWANGFEQATRVVNELKPDFVFIDINMPRYNGLNVLQKLKSMESLQPSTFVMYSTHISDEDQARAMQLGAKHCIHKAENIKILLKQLNRLFNDKTHSA